MFTASFFTDIQQIVDDLFVGSEKCYIERAAVYDSATNQMAAPTPAGQAIEAVLVGVSQDLVDGETVLKTDSSLVVPGKRMSFIPKPGDLVRLGPSASSEPALVILAARQTRSITIQILYEMVVRV
jgi:hypothetical protein